jgi:hypothetical protein
MADNGGQCCACMQVVEGEPRLCFKDPVHVAVGLRDPEPVPGNPLGQRVPGGL